MCGDNILVGDRNYNNVNKKTLTYIGQYIMITINSMPYVSDDQDDLVGFIPALDKIRIVSVC